MPTSAVVAGHPHCAPLDSASSSDVNAPAKRSAPAQSKRARERSEVSGTMRATAAVSNTPHPAVTQKIPRQSR